MIGEDASGPNALDLNSLLKNLESEILVNEQNLNDENDKRYMFKVDIFLTRCYKSRHLM